LPSSTSIILASIRIVVPRKKSQPNTREPGRTRHFQPTIEKTAILFLDVEKYAPSLQFLGMTLGPSFLLLAWLEKSIPGLEHQPC
jgi:hypothetical protein